MKIKLAYSKPVYRRPHRSFFLCGGWGEWVFVHRLRLLTIEIKVKINYKVSVFAYLSRNKRTHDILEDEDYISHIWDVVHRIRTILQLLTELGDPQDFF